MSFPGMLDHIIVETGGAKIPLNHVAVVSVIDAQTLSVTPYDPDVSELLDLNPDISVLAYFGCSSFGQTYMIQCLYISAVLY